MQHFFPTTVIICDCDISLIVTKTATEPLPKPLPRKACISAEGGVPGHTMAGQYFEDPMAVVAEQAPAVDGDLVEGGVFADEVEGFGEVLGGAVDPLALVAALGDGVELLGAEVALGSHGSY